MIVLKGVMPQNKRKAEDCSPSISLLDFFLSGSYHIRFLEMSAHLFICHVMRILQLIYTAMLAPEVTYVRDKEHGLQRGLPSENTGS